MSLFRFMASLSCQRENRLLQIFTGESQMRMPGREPLLENRNGILKQRNRLGKSPRTIHQVTEIVAR